MGDRTGRGDANERPAHRVCVSTFYLGTTEVTQEQWRQVMGAAPSAFRECGPDCPVESVSWNEAQEFLARVSRRSGRSYRLPTEAEWEYAARSRGRNDRYAGTGDPVRLGDHAWYGGNANGTVHPVAQKQGNALGIYDMSGNLWEWCSDRYDERFYARSPVMDPQGPEEGSARVVRGGAWTSSLEHTATSRRWFEPGYVSDFIGLRVAYRP
jgi:formylglycine-generating enzyme required for sulfatase activity